MFDACMIEVSKCETWKSEQKFKTMGIFWRPVFLLGVFQYVCIKQQTCESLSSIGSRSCEIIGLMKEKNTLVTQNCVLSDAWFRDLKI